MTSHTAVVFDVKVVNSSVPDGCGYTCIEYPAIVVLELRLEDGHSEDVWLAYDDDGGMTQLVPGGVGYSGGPILIIARGDAPTNQWLRQETHVIRDYVPNASTVTTIHLLGAGWDFESRFDSILLRP